MTNQEAGSLAFKLAGIYVFIEAISSLYTTGLLLAGTFHPGIGGESLNWRTVLLLASLPTALLLALGTVLIRRSLLLAKAIFQHPDAVATPTITASELQALLLAVLGISMIGSALPHFARMATYFGPPAESAERSILSVVNQYWPEFVQRCAAVLIGALLIIGRRGVTAGWLNIRRTWLMLRRRQNDSSES